MAVSEGKGKITEQELAKSLTDKLQPAAIKADYESNPNTNVFTDAEKAKLAGIEEGAQVNTVHSVAGKTGNITLSKSDVGLDNVDNVKQMPIAGGTFTGIVVAQNNTSYDTKQVRNIIISTADPSGGSNGDIWLKYKV